jgi:hypothetical protein
MAVSEAQAALALKDLTIVCALVKRGKLVADKGGFPMRITRESVERYRRDRLPNRESGKRDSRAANLLNRREIARRHGVSASLVRDLIASGRLTTTARAHERPAWAHLVDEDVAEVIFQSRHPCECGAVRMSEPGPLSRRATTDMSLSAPYILWRTISCTAGWTRTSPTHDCDSARGWRELAAGLVARWEQLKRAKG